LTRTGYTFNGWNTSANGSGTAHASGGTFSMPASAVRLYAQWTIKPKPLRAGTTTCKGTYSGTGMTVVVPTGATCTLVPGTHVTNSVTVNSGGTLLMNSVRIGGSLAISGSATVCGSKIGHDVRASGGTLVLGGPGCAGNTIAGNTFVSNDRHNVWIWGNTVHGGLTAKRLTGATTSIVGNVVGTLFVGNSGPPVVISGNHAVTATCVNNKGQTGSGNKTTGTNTCPR
jgi:uncharacterized repeat protein (TIGR02543 family)